MASSGNIKLASFDGGGPRAYTQLVMMHNFMHQLRHFIPAGEESGVLLPCNYFHLMGGSDMGGLIVIMLVKLQMSVDDAIAAFANIVKSVYAKNLKPAQRTSRLKNCMKSLLKKKGLPLDLKLNDRSKDGPCVGFVVAQLRLNLGSENVCLRTYPAQREPPSDITVVEAALATCALQPEFLPLSSGPSHMRKEYIGAGLGQNNPVIRVVNEASSYFTQSPKIGLLLSLGSGNPGVHALGQGDDALFHLMQDMLRDSEKEAKRVQQGMASFGSYFRFSVEQGMQNIDTRADALDWIFVQTNSYLAADEIVPIVDECVAKMSCKE